VARVGSSGGLPVLPSPDAMASMGIVGDGTGVLQVGSSSSFSHSYGGGLPSSSSVRAQVQQHMQNMQLQQQVFALTSVLIGFLNLLGNCGAVMNIFN
jgi:hypothetical protein